MAQKREYIVYKHTCPNGKVYIGITCQPIAKRFSNGYGYKRQTHFYNAILKYGWDNIKHEIMFDGLTKEYAEQKEIELISAYKSNDKKHGYNVANGGCTIGTMSEETKRKISDAEKGRTISDDTRKKMSDAQKGKSKKPLSDETKEKIRAAMTGRVLSDEWKHKISVGNKGKTRGNGRVTSYDTKIKQRNNNTKKIAVSQYDKNGVYIKSYPSMMEAERQLNISNSKICAVCKGKRITAGGYVWRYA